MSARHNYEDTKPHLRVPELCEGRGGRPGLPVPNNSPNGLSGREATLNLKSPTSWDLGPRQYLFGDSSALNRFNQPTANK